MNTSKIIKGVVSNGRYTVTAPIIKEDYGLYLKIEGVELPSTYEVDFSNSESSGTSVTMIGNSDGVRIPRQFIDSGKDVFAFLYHVGEDFGRTVYKFRIPNKVRPDRTNEEPTPEEQSVIDQAISALNEAVEQTQDAQQAIENMSVSATTLAEGSTATVTKTEQDGVVHLEFGIPKGQTGAQGERGEKGDKGDRGEQGIQGIQGERGLQGAKGDKGDKGDTGATGAQGERGPQGIQGETGPQGPQGAQGDDYVLTEQDKHDIADIAEADLTPTILNAFPTDIASGAVASFPDGADDLPLKSLVVDINPIQDLSNGDPSPENICPISGWTEVDVEQRGVNIWDEEWENGTFNTTTGQNIDSGNALVQIRAKRLIPVVAGNEYYIKTSIGVWMMFFDIDKNVIAPPSGVHGKVNNCIRIGGDTSEPFNKFTPPQGCAYVRFYCQGVYGTTYNHDISINYPSTDHDYHPYTGRSITIDLGQTVYGGKLDVLSGKLTVYPYYASYNGETLTGEWISDRDVYAVGTTPTIGAQVVNIGAEGTEYQLDPHEVSSLLGQNNIFADTGDVSCEYRADTKLYIEKLTQPEEDDMVANSAIASGQFFMIGNSLYRALANIASGATITVGTNAQRVSLSDALNLVNA